MRPRRFSSERSGIPDSLLSAPSLSHWVSLLTPIFPDAPDDKCRGIGGSMARLIKGLETKLIHAGEPEPLIGGAVTMPIFQSSTYEYAGQTSYHDLRYIRLNNTPNHARCCMPSTRRSKMQRRRWARPAGWRRFLPRC